jgi:predicted transcriptional regulator
MASKTTVAIDDTLRKRIKKLAAWLDLTQGEVIGKAIEAYEKVAFQAGQNEQDEDESKLKEAKVRRILKQATEREWQSDPEARELQQRLMSGPETIDDFVIKKWRSGLFE